MTNYTLYISTSDYTNTLRKSEDLELTSMALIYDLEVIEFTSVILPLLAGVPVSCYSGPYLYGLFISFIRPLQTTWLFN